MNIQTTEVSTTTARSTRVLGGRYPTSVALLTLTLAATAFGPMQHASGFSVGPKAGLNCISAICTAAAVLATHGVLSAYVENHQQITGDALVATAVTFTPFLAPIPIGFSQPILRVIEDADANVDYNQPAHELHFDNEFLTQASSLVIAGRQLIIAELGNNNPIIGVDLANNMRVRLGQYLHTLQDFFAHSSWANMNPSPSIAGLPTFVSGGDEAVIPNPGTSFPACLPDDSSELTGGLSSLTSGYAGSVPYMQAGIAPPSKCSHGFLGNGIHSDWNGRENYATARQWAVLATTAYVQAIIDAPNNNPDSVCMLMTGSPCPAQLSVREGASSYLYLILEAGGTTSDEVYVGPWTATSSAPGLTLCVAPTADPFSVECGATVGNSVNSADYLAGDLMLYFDTAGLSAGTYNGFITIEGRSGRMTVISDTLLDNGGIATIFDDVAVSNGINVPVELQVVPSGIIARSAACSFREDGAVITVRGTATSPPSYSAPAYTIGYRALDSGVVPWEGSSVVSSPVQWTCSSWPIDSDGEECSSAAGDPQSTSWGATLSGIGALSGSTYNVNVFASDGTQSVIPVTCP